MSNRNPNSIGRTIRISVAGLALAGVSLCIAHTARAVEIVPALGLTKSVNGDGDAKAFGSLAIRGSIIPDVPFLQGEISGAYREEKAFDDHLKVRMWPVTASLWVKPVPMLYAGGGVGWYQTSFDWDDSVVGATNETKQEFGIHLGGGVRMPLAPAAALDLGGRYVMMREQDFKLIPEKFDPDFWQTQLGLAFHF